MHLYVHNRFAWVTPPMLTPLNFPHPLLAPTPQVAGAISSLFILIIIVKLGELFQDLPKVSPHPNPRPSGLEGLGQGLRSVCEAPDEGQRTRSCRFSGLRSLR